MARSPDPMPGASPIPVRVTVPAKAFYSLEHMRTITEQILARLGCPGCHSGRDIRFHLEEEFTAVEDAKGGIRVLGAGERL
jgi:hypothetical protein